MNRSITDPVETSRLLPQLSFRVLFAITTLGAVLAAVARLAGVASTGNTRSLAICLLVGVGFLTACLMMFAIMFLLLWLISLLWYRPANDAVQGSPFADDQLPPQILPPRRGQA